MANDLERLLDTPEVKILKVHEGAYAAKALVDAENFAGARSALEAYAQASGQYKLLAPWAKAMRRTNDNSVVKDIAEGCYEAAEKIIDDSTIGNFLDYLKVSEGYNWLQMSPNARTLLQIRTDKKKVMKIGDLKKKYIEAIKFLEDFYEGKLSKDEGAAGRIESYQSIQETYGPVFRAITSLVEKNTQILAQKAMMQATQDASENMEREMLGLRPKKKE